MLFVGNSMFRKVIELGTFSFASVSPLAPTPSYLTMMVSLKLKCIAMLNLLGHQWMSQ